MKSLEESIALSMDCENTQIVQYLPYILQDFFEIGSSRDSILKIIQENIGRNHVKVLDLGCGKGAVIIGVAERIDSDCLGIDGVADFIEYARKISNEIGLRNCKFICGDIRKEIDTLNKYDIIILASIGPVFGNYYDTMMKLIPMLEEDGIILLDDGYLKEGNSLDHELIGTKKNLVSQIEKSGLKLIREYTGDQISDRREYQKQFLDIKKRCHELKEMYPDKKKLFDKYVTRQKIEYENLANSIVCSTMVLKRRF
jgi:SAM-dependent methyltransferase